MKAAQKERLLSLAASLLLVALLAAGVLTRPDRAAQDALYQHAQHPAEEIVILEIDEETLETLGPYNSWDRNVMAEALEALASDPDSLPAVVAVDALYAGQTDPAADARLAAAAEKLGCVVSASAAEFGQRLLLDEEGRAVLDPDALLHYTAPYEAFAAVTTTGHINVMYDPDGVLRHAQLTIEPEPGRQVRSLACETAARYLESRGEELRLPETDANGRYYLAFSARPGSYSEGLSLIRLLRGEIPASWYAGKIVLIGPYAAGLQDSYLTAVDRARLMYGVEVHANAIQGLLEENYKRELSDLPQLLAMLPLCFALAWLFSRKKVGLSAILCAGVIVLGLGASLLLYELGLVVHVLWLPAAALALYVLSVAAHYVRAAMERQRVTRTFQRYVAPEIVREILKEGEESLSLGGKLCRIAVLFVDIRGFTAMSERLEPQKVVSILNRYLAMTSLCVERNGGTLDKFVGDATMAFWGAPLPQEDPVLHAARTALDIVRGAEELSRELESELGEQLHVGVGVHYGPAVVGNMGSERRMDYTAIGDTVNTAARLESNAPGGTVYISRAVADALGGAARCTSLGSTLRLKGKAEGFEILTLDALTEDDKHP